MESPVALLVLICVLLTAVHLVYNVYFHPLRNFPGPLLARATAWWKTYVDMVKQENMIDVLIRLHQKYG